MRILRLHDVDLAAHRGVVELVARRTHASALERQHLLEVLDRHGLGVVGHVPRGGGVLEQGQLAELLAKRGAARRGAELELQVLDEVREPDPTDRILGGADVVAQVDGGEVGALVVNERDLHAVRDLDEVDVVAEVERAFVALQRAEVGLAGPARARDQAQHPHDQELSHPL